MCMFYKDTNILHIFYKIGLSNLGKRRKSTKIEFFKAFWIPTK